MEELAKETVKIFENSDVLIIGDDFGLKNDKLIEILTDKLSAGLNKPLTIQNMAHPGENILKVKARLMALDKLPPIIIYMGGTSEFSEDLYPQDLSSFSQNFKRFKNDYVSTLITLFPNLSKLIFLTDINKKITFENIKPFVSYSDSWFQRVSEAIYYFYQEELYELADYIKEHKSNLVIVTPPVNIEKMPAKACDNSVIDEITINQFEIQKLIKENQLKKAQTLALALDNNSTGNAITKYLVGKVLLETGKTKLATEFFKEAKALECSSNGANVIINEINKKVATNKSLNIVKFDEMLYQKIGEDSLFINDNVIQFIHWDILVNSLTNTLKEILQL